MSLEQQAHQHATAAAQAYVAKFTRPVLARAVDGVYVHAYKQFVQRHG